MYDLLVAVKARLETITAGKTFQQPGGVSVAELGLYLISPPPKREDTAAPDGIPFVLIVPGEGEGLDTVSETFGIQFTFYATDENGNFDHEKGLGYIDQANGFIKEMYFPRMIEGWELTGKFKKYYGDGGEFKLPYYTVSFLCTAIKRQTCY